MNVNQQEPVTRYELFLNGRTRFDVLFVQKNRRKSSPGCPFPNALATFWLKVVQHSNSYQTNRDATCKILYCVIEFHGLGDFITPSRFSVKTSSQETKPVVTGGFSLIYSYENLEEIKTLKDHVWWSFMIWDSGFCWVDFSCMSRTPECSEELWATTPFPVLPSCRPSYLPACWVGLSWPVPSMETIAISSKCWGALQNSVTLHLKCPHHTINKWSFWGGGRFNTSESWLLTQTAPVICADYPDVSLQMLFLCLHRCKPETSCHLFLPNLIVAQHGLKSSLWGWKWKWSHFRVIKAIAKSKMECVWLFTCRVNLSRYDKHPCLNQAALVLS